MNIILAIGGFGLGLMAYKASIPKEKSFKEIVAESNESLTVAQTGLSRQKRREAEIRQRLQVDMEFLVLEKKIQQYQREMESK